jgi:hypothetical protein
MIAARAWGTRFGGGCKGVSLGVPGGFSQVVVACGDLN